MNFGCGRVIEDKACCAPCGKGGVGLDVCSKTLLPANGAFFDPPNVTLPPHMSGATQAYYERNIALFCENVRWYIAGESLVNVVDKRREY